MKTQNGIITGDNGKADPIQPGRDRRARDGKAGALGRARPSIVRGAKGEERNDSHSCHRHTLIARMSEALLAAGNRVVIRMPGNTVQATATLLRAYMSSLTQLADRDVLRELVSTALWPDRTVAKQLFVLKTRMIGQIASLLKHGYDDDTVHRDLNRSKAGFVVFCVFAGVLSTYLQDERITLESANRILDCGVSHVFTGFSGRSVSAPG
jgi:hypothetical protein